MRAQATVRRLGIRQADVYKGQHVRAGAPAKDTPVRSDSLRLAFAPIVAAVSACVVGSVREDHATAKRNLSPAGLLNCLSGGHTVEDGDGFP